MADLKSRMLRAAWLDGALYEEVEADTTCLKQAMLVVGLSSAAAGIGASVRGGVIGLVLGVLVALIGWYIWAFLTYWIGTRLLPEPQTQADLGQLLRTTGFASAPGLIRVVGVIPAITNLVFAVAGVWMLVAMVVAVRHALDYRGTLRAVGVCVIGWAIQLAFLLLAVALVSRPS